MNKGLTLVRLLITIGIIFIIPIIFVAPFITIKFSPLGTGEHSGYITAIDQHGYIFKNYDVYFKTDNSSSQEDLYCINRNNTELIKQAQEANKNRSQVTLSYHGVRGFGFGLCHATQIDKIIIQ